MQQKLAVEELRKNEKLEKARQKKIDNDNERQKKLREEHQNQLNRVFEKQKQAQIDEIKAREEKYLSKQDSMNRQIK